MAGRYVTLAAGPILATPGRPADLPAILLAARALCGPMERSAILVYVSEPALSVEAVRERLGGAAEQLGGTVIAPLAGHPFQVLPRYARERQASLIITGLPQERPVTEGLAARLLAETPCPVLLVPPDLPSRWGEGGSVLLPLDGTPSTSGAVPWATALAVWLHGSLEVLYAAGNPPPAEVGSMTIPAYSDQPQHEWPMWRREFLGRFCACYKTEDVPLEPQLVVRAAPPADAILNEASQKQPDLIVLGWHGSLSGGRAATLSAILEHARWPLLAIKIAHR